MVTASGYTRGRQTRDRTGSQRQGKTCSEEGQTARGTRFFKTCVPPPAASVIRFSVASASDFDLGLCPVDAGQAFVQFEL